MNLEKKQKKPLYLLQYLLLLVLLLNSAFLSYKYIKFYYLGDMLKNLTCAQDCDAVMMSSYALMFGIPVPVFGFAYFLLLTICFSLLISNFQLVKKNTQKKIFAFLLLLGISFALCFIYILSIKLKLFCKFCMLSHITLFLFSFVYLFSLKTNK